MIGMKKICIGAVIAGAVLSALFLAYRIYMNNNVGTVEVTTSYTDENGVYHEVKYTGGQNSGMTKQRLIKEDEISTLLLQMEWIDSASVSIFSADNLDDYTNAVISVAVGTNRSAEAAEIDSVVETITTQLKGMKKENIIISDESGDSIYPVM